MRIIVDADGCPVREIVEKTARAYKLEAVFVTDYNHILHSDYARIITVDQQQDSADLRIAALARENDIVVTGDYGVAALTLAKGCAPIQFSGVWYTDENIDSFLLNRHIGMQIRRRGKYPKGPKKRTGQMDKEFEEGLKKLVEKILIKLKTRD